jgi:hypothetical protein
MNQKTLSTLNILIALTMLAMLISACQPTSPTQPIDAFTLEPSAGPTDDPLWPGDLCNQGADLPTGDPSFKPTFNEIVTEGKISVRRGQFINKFGQVFEITVKGIDPSAVKDYTDNLKICMELVPVNKPAFESKLDDEKIEDHPGEESILNANPENLIIFTDPSEKSTQAFKDSYIWLYVIDPSISNGVTHDYTKQCHDGSNTTVTMGTSGGISATHSRRPFGGTNSSSTRTILPTANTNWNSSGRATYDLGVTGNVAAGTYTYRVSGTIWNFGSTSARPTGGGTDCTS